MWYAEGWRWRGGGSYGEERKVEGLSQKLHLKRWNSLRRRWIVFVMWLEATWWWVGGFRGCRHKKRFLVDTKQSRSWKKSKWKSLEALFWLCCCWWIDDDVKEEEGDLPRWPAPPHASPHHRIMCSFSGKYSCRSYVFPIFPHLFLSCVASLISLNYIFGSS